VDETADDLCLTVLNEVCTNCAVAGIVDTGQRGVHTAGRDLSPCPQTETEQTWTVAIAAFFHVRAFSLASEQVVRRGSCFSSPHSKQALRRSEMWERSGGPSSKRLICCSFLAT
jgi:hypothetical protein